MTALRVRWLLFSIATCTAGALGLSSAPPAIGADKLAAASLNGVWRGDRFSDGKGEEPAKGVQLEIVFQDNQVKANRLPDGAIGEATFTLSEQGTEIDAVGTSRTYKGKTYLGIIKLDGDTLYWCSGSVLKDQKRPATFEADPKQQSYLIIVKRQQGP
jgi:uncharacterized protein (TIGR03067 family)